MSDYLLLLGNTPQLSRLELESLFPDLSWRSLSEELLSLSVDLTEEKETTWLTQLVSDCAGIVKVYKVEAKVNNDVSDEELLAHLADLITTHSPKVHFSLQQAGPQQRNLSNERVKDYLQSQNIKARYFSAALTASALLLHHAQATEVLLFNLLEEKQLLLARVAAVQNIDNWTRKDRQKPYANRKKGMLPPKVALMMVNIALGNWQQATAGQTTPLLYDPFCGSGTILMEAALRGLEVMGSDLDSEAVSGSRSNLDWLAEVYKVPTPGLVFQADVAHLPLDKFSQHKVDLLVSEPFLGKQTPREEDLANIFKGLEKLYLGAFNSFSQILRPGARICLIFPKAVSSKKTHSMAALIDKLQAKGYNLLVEPVLYARAAAQIQREICLFSFEPPSSQQLKG